MGFVDHCKITVQAGKGGDGIIAWRREAHVPMGGPAGGNGGQGGSIYFVGDHNETSLERFSHDRRLRAQDGERGGIKNMNGHNAPDVYYKVPLGTIVRTSDGQVLADVLADGYPYLIAKGGVGGHGNFYFKSNFNKAPQLYELGEPGEYFELELELQEIADVGIIGLPNAGKSTLIGRLTNAHPRTGNYPFTTLIPILGMLEPEHILLADLPGLIQGASEGVGLGHAFLRHIERCRVLIHLISLDPLDHPEESNQQENGVPQIVQDYQTILSELEKYDETLTGKTMLVVGNKLDQPGAEENYTLLNQVVPVMAISAQTGVNLDILKAKIVATVQALPPLVDQTNIVERSRDPEAIDKRFTFRQVAPGAWEVECPYLEYWIQRIPMTTNDNIIRFNQKLNNLQIREALEANGFQKGDRIRIHGIELSD